MRSELGAQPLASGNVLGDDDELAEEIVRQFDAQRQIEADGAAPDIGAPAHHVGVVLQDGIDFGRRIATGVNGRTLRQPQIDQQFRPVG